MAETPDIGKIIGLIMENPSLIAEISALARRDGRDAADAASERETASKSEVTSVEADEPAVTSTPTENPARINRHRLLSAMKPYLSEGRCRAIDQMTSLGEILDAMRRR